MIEESLEAELSKYSGHGKLYRLQHWIRHGNSKEAIESLFPFLINLAKEMKCVSIYKETFDQYNILLEEQQGIVAKSLLCDDTWLSKASDELARVAEALEMDLKQAKASQAKDVIKEAYRRFAGFFFDHGLYEEALANFMKFREYSSDGEALVQASLACVEVIMLLNRPIDAAACLTKLKYTNGKTTSEIAQYDALAALFFMRTHKYKDAATHFLRVKPDLLSQGNVLCHIMSARDLALYSCLCAIASLDHVELKANVGEEATFRETLDFAPSVRDIALNFSQCRYKLCLDELAALQESKSSRSDVFLCDHWSELIRHIRDRSILQFSFPFLNISFGKMAQELSSTEEELEKDVERLIHEGRLDARIDSKERLLCKRDVDLRQESFSRALALGEELVESAQMMILRINLRKNDYAIRAPSSRRR